MSGGIENKPPAVHLAETDRVTLEKLRLPNTIVVTSGSAIKVNTVVETLKRLFPDRTFNVIGLKVASGEDEQPVEGNTERGARSRIANAKARWQEEQPATPAAFISIENGIFTVGDAWEDKAVVVVEFQGTQSFPSAISKGVVFPVEDVEAARTAKGGFEKNTVGSFITKRLGGDSQNPHAVLTNGGFTREQQMTDAITAALVKVAKELS